MNPKEIMEQKDAQTWIAGLESHKLSNLLREIKFHQSNVQIWRHQDPIIKDISKEKLKQKQYQIYAYNTFIIKIDDSFTVIEQGAIYFESLEENAYREIVRHFLSLLKSDVEEL